MKRIVLVGGICLVVLVSLLLIGSSMDDNGKGQSFVTQLVNGVPPPAT